jgi:protein-S-isoprenylcysteine O-methyltransferase Ste14
MKNIFRQFSSFIVPVLMTTILPLLIVQRERHSPSLVLASSPFLWIIGPIIFLAGLLLFIITVPVFIRIGNGTIMPWYPTRKLVTVGVYRYVRNPMILSVLLLLVGEFLLFASYGISALAILFFVINSIYFVYSEEPGVEQRFGEEYREYKCNVPRWIPRRKPWHPLESEVS